MRVALFAAAALLLVAGLANAEPFQSRHLLATVYGEADTTVQGTGTGAGALSLNIGSDASTGALSAVDPSIGVLTEEATAGSGGYVEVVAAETFTDGTSNADSVVVSEDRGPTDADGMVAVSSDGAATGEDFVGTSANAHVVYQEGPVVSEDDGMVIGSTAIANGDGSSAGAAGGDSVADASVHGEIDLETTTSERAVDLNEDQTMGYFGYSLGEVVVEGLAGGHSESEDEDNLSDADNLSQSQAELDLGAGVNAVATAGLASADVTAMADGLSSGSGDIIATNEVSLSGSTLSDSTDNTLRPDLGFPMAMAENAEAISEADVTAVALTEDTPGFTNLAAGGLSVDSGSLSETGVEVETMIPGLLEGASGHALSESYAGGQTSGSAIGNTEEANYFDTTVSGYTLTSTDVSETQTDESYSEGLARSSVQAASEGSGGIFVQGGASAGVGSVAESDAGYVQGLFEAQRVDVNGLAGGYASSYADAEETMTSTALAASSGGDLINLNYPLEDDVNGGQGFATLKTRLEADAMGAGEGYSSSLTSGLTSGGAQLQGVIDLGGFVADSPGFGFQIDTSATIDAITEATGEETLVEGTASLTGLNSMAGTGLGSFENNVLAVGGLGATGTTVDYDVHGASTVIGTDAAGLAFTANADSQTMLDFEVRGSGNGEEGMSSDGLTDVAILIDASGDDIYTTGELDTATGSGSALGYGAILDDGTNTGFGASALSAQAGGLVSLGGYDASEDESSFLLSGYSEAGTEVLHPIVGGLDSEADAFAYANEIAGASGATMVEGGVAAETSLGTASGTLALSEGLYDKYSVGLGVAEGTLHGLAGADGTASGAPGMASLFAEAGSTGATGTATGAAADDLTFDASEASAGGYGVLGTYATIGTTGYDTGVQTSSLSAGMIAGLVGSGVDGSKGSMSTFESDTATHVMSSAEGPDADATSATSALLGAEAVSYTDPAGAGLGTVIRDVDASGTGYADASDLGVVHGSSESDSTSEIVTLEDCERGEDCFTVTGGFAAITGLEGGLATAGAYALPKEQKPFFNDNSLQAGAESHAAALTLGFAAALDVEGNEVSGALAGSAAVGSVLTDSEADIFPGGVTFKGESLAQAQEMETFELMLGPGSRTDAVAEADIDYNNGAIIVPTESLFVETDAIAETFSLAFAVASEDYGIGVAAEADGFSEAEAFSSFDEDNFSFKDTSATTPETFFVSRVEPLP
jgi:hypothetical protein